MKKVIALFALIPLFGYGQVFNLSSIMTLNQAFKKSYQVDPAAALAQFDGLRGKGFLIGVDDFTTGPAPVRERTDVFSFLDLNADAVKENVSIVTGYGDAGGRLGYKIITSVSTDNLAQYHRWLTDLKGLTGFKQTINAPFTTTYEGTSTIGGSQTITVSIPFTEPINTPQRERQETTQPVIYSIVYMRIFPR